MENKLHYEPVETAKEPLQPGYLLITSTNGKAVVLKPRPDTVLMTREEVERMKNESYEQGYYDGAGKGLPE